MVVFTVRLGDESFQVYLQKGFFYPDGTPAIRAFTDQGEPFANLTVAIEGTKLKQGEYLVKTWGENRQLAEAVLRNNLLVDTGRRVRTEYVEAQVWREP